MAFILVPQVFVFVVPHWGCCLDAASLVTACVVAEIIEFGLSALRFTDAPGGSVFASLKRNGSIAHLMSVKTEYV